MSREEGQKVEHAVGCFCFVGLVCWVFGGGGGELAVLEL
jgi:hypothetical protein